MSEKNNLSKENYVLVELRNYLKKYVIKHLYNNLNFFL